jgi:hypothetical protein
LKKFVVTELKILNQQKYDAIPEIEKPKVGTVFDELDVLKSGWYGNEMDITNLHLDDQTDKEWNELEREYKIYYKNTGDEKQIDELFSSFEEMSKKINDLIKNKNIDKICYTWKIKENDNSTDDNNHKYKNVIYPICWVEPVRYNENKY